MLGCGYKWELEQCDYDREIVRLRLYRVFLWVFRDRIKGVPLWNEDIQKVGMEAAIAQAKEDILEKLTAAVLTQRQVITAKKVCGWATADETYKIKHMLRELR